jgi:hypothetical protein
MFASEGNYVRVIPPRRAQQFPETGYGPTGGTIYHFSNISFSLHSNSAIYDLFYRNAAMLLITLQCYHATARL